MLQTIKFCYTNFLNKVTDEQAVNILRKFVDNAKRRSENYIWVAERQTKMIFSRNIHFT
jgi:hypothetical protein